MISSMSICDYLQPLYAIAANGGRITFLQGGTPSPNGRKFCYEIGGDFRLSYDENPESLFHTVFNWSR